MYHSRFRLKMHICAIFLRELLQMCIFFRNFVASFPKGTRRTLKEIGTLGFGSCHTFWKHKKRILREEYHMIWRSPQDLNPECCFD